MCKGYYEATVVMASMGGAVIVIAALAWTCRPVKISRVSRAGTFESISDASGWHEQIGEALADAATKIKILISTLQVLSKTGSVFAVRFPNTFNTILRYLNSLSLDFIHLMPMECMVRTNFHVELRMRTLIPLGLIVFIALCKFVLMCCRFWAAEKRTTTLMFLVLFFVYPSTSAAIFSTFQCEVLDDGAGTSVLRADLAIDCDSSEHQSMIGYAMFMVVIYPIGVPALFALTFWCNRKKLAELKQGRRLVVAEAISKGEGFRKKSKAIQALRTEVDLPDAVRRLVGPYDSRYFYYEIIECFRKLLLVCMPVFFDPPGSVSQLIFGLMCSVLSTIVLVFFQPYKYGYDNMLAVICEVTIFFAILSSVALKYDEQTLADSRNIDGLLSFLLLTPFVIAPFEAMVSGLKILDGRKKRKTGRTELIGQA